MEHIEAEIIKHLERLCVEIGPRPNGSRGNHAAAEYIQSVFERAGLAVERQEYSCPAWECDETDLKVNGDALDASTNAFSPPCDVTAPGVAMKTMAELEAADLSGRVGILHGDLTRAPLGCKSWFLTSERDHRIIRLLEEKEPAALIAVQPRPGDLDRLIEDWEFSIPSATVNAYTGLAILRQETPIVHLRIDSRQSPGHTCNVVARKAGSRQDRVVLCAHYDTKIDTPGAYDNGGGVAVLLALAQLLSRREHAFSLEWIAFTGEEYLPTGDDEYVRRQENEFEQIVAAINTDLAGTYLGANSITTIAGSQTFHDHIVGLTESYPAVVWVDPWPESNHSTFSFRGVPSIAVGSVGTGPLQHTRSDAVEWLNPASVGEIVRLITDIVESLQDKSLAWCRPSPDRQALE